MKRLQLLSSYVPGLALTLLAAAPLLAQVTQTAATPEDITFVAQVSQGGRYEVEASRLALHKATAQDVKDLAGAEVHDHMAVNAELHSISAQQNVPIEPNLNATFQQRLDKLRTLAGSEFDDAYITDMKAIHDADEKLFAAEAVSNGASPYKLFAAKTDRIVKRHIGALHGTDTAPIR